MRRIAVIGMALLVTGACTGGSDPALSLDDLQGYWLLDSWGDGELEWNVVSEGEMQYSAYRPWIRFDDRIEGSGGCNDFRGLDPDHRVEGGRLIPGEVLFTAVLCGVDGPPWIEMRAEEAIQMFLWSRGDSGFEVTFWNRGQMMEWSDGALRMSWIKTDRPPDDWPGAGVPG